MPLPTERPDTETATQDSPVDVRALSPAARRALAEAEERRAREQAALAPEIHGRGGLEPVRYGDWEIKGLASDF